jgi:uncharacterized protein (TIGR03083 family)
MDDNEVWSAVDRRRSAIVELLAGLTPAEWDTPSLCEGWRVRDVAAHLTMPLLTKRQLAGLVLRHPGGTNRLIRDGSLELARRHDTGQLIAMITRLVGQHRPMPTLTCREMLIDVTDHHLDMALPLGREVHVPPVEVAEAADRVLSYGGRGNAKVFRQVRLGGYRLTATDHTWSTGAGPEVRGSMTDLFLLLTGRTVRVGELRGPGADDLRRTIAA